MPEARDPLVLRRIPWKPLLALAGAFFLLGAAGESDMTMILGFVGFAVSIGGAGVGYGITKSRAEHAKERAEQAHVRIGHLETDLADAVKGLTTEFTNMRLELARAGAMRAQARPTTGGGT